MNSARTSRISRAAVRGAVFLAVVATPAHAAVSGDPLLDFEGMVSRFTGGLSCGAVPTTDGDSLPLAALLTSDSSARTATVTYSIPVGFIPSGGVVLNGGGYPVGEGKVMVVKGTRYGFGGRFLGTAERPGPPAARRDTCSYGNPGGSGVAELVHLIPVQRPTAAQVQTWCQTQSWYSTSPGTCPTGVLE